jgi:hypothetical protein
MLLDMELEVGIPISRTYNSDRSTPQCFNACTFLLVLKKSHRWMEKTNYAVFTVEGFGADGRAKISKGAGSYCFVLTPASYAEFQRRNLEQGTA